MNINHTSTIEQLQTIDLNSHSWEVKNYYTATVLVNGIWLERNEWEQLDKRVSELYLFVREIVVTKGYQVMTLGRKRSSHQWDNKTAVELVNKTTNETLFIGLCDWKICIGSDIDIIDNCCQMCEIN